MFNCYTAAVKGVSTCYGHCICVGCETLPSRPGFALLVGGDIARYRDQESLKFLQMSPSGIHRAPQRGYHGVFRSVAP
jgi:hypothetical protein